jgi:predicted enzyme related to lactoylglutathione lyase
VAETEGSKMFEGVFYFEIPVSDMERALAFYRATFECDLERYDVDGYDMALFPRAEGAATGALAKGDVYIPAKTGPIIYFTVPDIDATLARAVAAGGDILYPKKDIGELGFVGEFQDSESNRIALSQPR